MAFDETTRLEDVDQLLAILNGGSAPGFSAESLAAEVCTGGRTRLFLTEVSVSCPAGRP